MKATEVARKALRACFVISAIPQTSIRSVGERLQKLTYSAPIGLIPDAYHDPIRFGECADRLAQPEVFRRVAKTYLLLRAGGRIPLLQVPGRAYRQLDEISTSVPGSRKGKTRQIL